MGIDKGKDRDLRTCHCKRSGFPQWLHVRPAAAFFDASMGVGTAVIGLASVIIGTALFGRIGVFGFSISVILGSILYKGLCGSSHPYRTTIHGLKTGNGSLIPLDSGTFLKDREISGQKA